MVEVCYDVLLEEKGVTRTQDEGDSDVEGGDVGHLSTMKGQTGSIYIHNPGSRSGQGAQWVVRRVKSLARLGCEGSHPSLAVIVQRGLLFT